MCGPLHSPLAVAGRFALLALLVLAGGCRHDASESAVAATTVAQGGSAATPTPPVGGAASAAPSAPSDPAPPVASYTAPVAVAQATKVVSAGVVPLTLLATSSSAQRLTYAVVTAPAQGSLTGSGSNLVYVPKAGYLGLDSFTFKANDGVADSNIAVVSIEVTKASVGKAKVYLMAGQSNMEGHGVNADLSMIDPSLSVSRSTVYARSTISTDARLGPLKPGYGASDSEFGPELKFGQVLGDVFAENVYLYKAAQGGTTLYEASAWKPTSQGGTAGNLYAQMISGFKSFLKSELADKGIDYEVVGFIWFQGENDAVQGYQASYEDNLRGLLAAVRADLGLAKLPVVIGQINDTWGSNGAVVMAAQQTVASSDGNALLVTTADQRPYYHYGSASYVVIGSRMAHAALKQAGRAVAEDDEYTVAPGARLEIAAKDGVLANDSAATPVLGLVSGPAHGSLSLAADGSFAYTAAAGFIGTDSFDYRLYDNGVAGNLARVRLRVRDATSSLVLRYGFDEASPTAFVDSASGITAIVRKPGVTAVAAGKSGGAAHFDGTGILEYLIDYPPPSYLDFSTDTDLTLATWIKTDGRLGASQVISSNEYFSSLEWGYLFATGDNGIGIKATIGAENGNRVTLSSTSGVIDDGHWHHVAAVFSFSTGQMLLYVDSAVVAQASIANVRGNLVRYESAIGGGAEGGESGLNRLQGSLDDFRIYRSALTARDIAALAK